MNYHLFKDLLSCPKCHLPIQELNGHFECEHKCNGAYPIYHEVPVLIDPAVSVFSFSDFANNTAPDIFFKTYKNPVLRFLKNIRPDITLNLASKKNYTEIALQLQKISNPRILIIGGSIDGQGIAALKQNLPTGTILVESDVAHGPNTNIIIDAHQIPFQDNCFDLVIAQAVLEHVLDPFLCVSEINRILKPGGLVYAETPFMQQVHGGKFDFHRFTALGHRRLFRHFKEEKSGLVAGAGSMMAWSLLYFITSFSPNKKTDKALSYLGSFASFWLKYFDYLLNQNIGSFDAACGLFFLGKKEPNYLLTDQELIASYRGNKS
jgi:SAM-dependent methyltransferase